HASLEAGLGTALGGDEARGTVIIAAAQPSAAEVAQVLARARSSSLEAIDRAPRAAARVFGSRDDGPRGLTEALPPVVETAPASIQPRLALARLYEHTRLPVRAHLHYSVLAFIDPTSLAVGRLSVLPPPEPLRIDASSALHPSALGLLRDALIQLGPLVI